MPYCMLSGDGFGIDQGCKFLVCFLSSLGVGWGGGTIETQDWDTCQKVAQSATVSLVDKVSKKYRPPRCCL